MSFTKTPEQQTKQRKRIPVQGSAALTANPHTFTNGFVQGCKYVNCFPVELPMFGDNPKHELIKAPGYETGQTFNMASGWSTLGNVMQVAGNDGYMFTSGVSGTSGPSVINGSGTVLYNGTGVVPTNNSPVVKIYDPTAAAGSVTYAWVMTVAGAVKIQKWNNIGGITTGAATAIPGGGQVFNPPVYLNGRLFVLDNNTNLIWNSDPGNVTSIIAGSFIVPQILGDNMVGIGKYKNHLVAIGQKGMEFFYDAGNAVGSPLARQEQYLIQYGCTLVSNIVFYGDIMYFMGTIDGQSYGLYEVVNFNLRKVSSFTIDSLLNAPGGEYAAGRLFNLNIVDVYGHPMIISVISNQTAPFTQTVFLAFEIPKRPYGIMAPTDGQWWEYPAFGSTNALFVIPGGASNPTLSLPGMPTWFDSYNGFLSGSTTKYNNVPFTFFLTYPSNTTATVNILSKDKSGAGSASVTATQLSDLYDFDSDCQKHIEYIDAVGDYGNNTVTLSWSTAMDYSGFTIGTTQTQSTLGPKNAIRWYNPGPARYLALRTDFTGTSNIVHRGHDISYNLGNV